MDDEEETTEEETTSEDETTEEETPDGAPTVEQVMALLDEATNTIAEHVLTIANFQGQIAATQAANRDLLAQVGAPVDSVADDEFDDEYTESPSAIDALFGDED